MTEGKRQFLGSALEVVIAKLKWDKEADPNDMDEDELSAFDNMRKVGETRPLSSFTVENSLQYTFKGTAKLR